MVEHPVGTVLDYLHVDMHARAGLAFGNLRSESNFVTVTVPQIPDYPFCEHKLIGSLLGRNRKELYLVLLINHRFFGKIPDLVMAILDRSPGRGYAVHALGAEIAEFGERSRLMIAFLVFCRIHAVILCDDIVFQFTHCIKLHARSILECLARLPERILRTAGQRLSVFVEERAEHRYRRDFRKRIDESRTKTREHIQVAASCFDKREQARTIHPFSASKNGIKVFFIVYDEIQGLETSVFRRIHEVYHLDVILLYKFDNILLGKFLGGFFQIGNDSIRIQ